jgi:hypothetical protein
VTVSTLVVDAAIALKGIVIAKAVIHVLKIFIFASGLSDKSQLYSDDCCLSDTYSMQKFGKIMCKTSQSLQFATYL